MNNNNTNDNNNKGKDDTVKCYMPFESVISQCFVFN